MRCKIGDIVIITNANEKFSYLIGKITTVIAKSDLPGNDWEIEVKNKEGLNLHAPDNYLTPIRDNPGEDETLSWAPVPWAPVPNKNKELEKV